MVYEIYCYFVNYICLSVSVSPSGQAKYLIHVNEDTWQAADRLYAQAQERRVSGV